MNKENFVQNFAGQFDDTDVSEISSGTVFKELDEWSSLLSLSVIAMCYEEYDVKLKGDDIKNANTVEDLFNIIKNRR